MNHRLLVSIIIILTLSSATSHAVEESLLEGWEAIPAGVYKPGDRDTLGSQSLLPRSDAGIWRNGSNPVTYATTSAGICGN